MNESSIHALLPALSQFREMHPGVQVRVHRMFSRDIPHEVLNYRLDVGAISFVPRDTQLQATEIRKDELTLVVPLKHALGKRREVNVEDLGNETFIGHIVESPYRRRVIELFARNRTALNMPIEMPTAWRKHQALARRFWAWAWPSSRVCACNGRSSAAG